MGPVSFRVFKITRPSVPQDVNLTKTKGANSSKQQTLRALSCRRPHAYRGSWLKQSKYHFSNETERFKDHRRSADRTKHTNLKYFVSRCEQANTDKKHIYSLCPENAFCKQKYTCQKNKRTEKKSVETHPMRAIL